MYHSPAISPDNKNFAGEVVAELPKVTIHEVLPAVETSTEFNAQDFTDHIRATIGAFRDDNVVYLELRVCVEKFVSSHLSLADVVTTALRAADVEGIDARIILSATAEGGVAERVAQLAVELTRESHGDRLVGLAFIADSDTSQQLRESLEAPCALLRAHYVPFAIDSADLIASDEDSALNCVDVVDAAVQLGAVRLGRAAMLIDDFSASVDGIVPGTVSSWVRDRALAVELTPVADRTDGAVDSLADHPLPLLQQLGFRCTVSAGPGADTEADGGMLSSVLVELTETFGYGLEEFFDLTIAALRSAFVSEPRRQALIESTILPHYESLADAHDFGEQDSEDGVDDNSPAQQEQAGDTD